MRLDLMPELAPERSYDRDKFTSRMALACDLSAIGKTNKEIADQLGVAESTVSIWLGDVRSKAYLRELRGRIAASIPDVMEKLHILSADIVDDLEALRKDESTKPELAAKIGFGLLDRAGYTPVQKVAHYRAPSLPPELADRVVGALEESKEIRAKFAFIAPPSRDTDEVAAAAEVEAGVEDV